MVVRLSTGLSRIINKIFLISSLKLLVSEANISKSSKLMEQSHCNRWWETADCFTCLTRFSVKLETPTFSAALVKKHKLIVFLTQSKTFFSR